MSYIAELKEQLVDLQEENSYLKSLLDAFFTGNIPQGASLDHMKLAKYGRVRLAELAKTPALLAK